MAKLYKINGNIFEVRPKNEKWTLSELRELTATPENEKPIGFYFDNSSRLVLYSPKFNHGDTANIAVSDEVKKFGSLASGFYIHGPALVFDADEYIVEKEEK